MDKYVEVKTIQNIGPSGPFVSNDQYTTSPTNTAMSNSNKSFN